MRLKSFEIHGFKTFADKISLSMEDGVTAVVGPNGSGKSNIAEAIRWVLGEQNPRLLRCEKKMDEVIFHGSEKRSPVGFAEVSLVLDNTDRTFPIEQDDVTISRRLYRSGESEYTVGKTAVRLKDIVALLMDTGLGPDGYSIIGQGMVKKIISDRTGDRRKVFEEACGISKYRFKKEESENKLGSAQLNLVRINDKIEELVPQVESLKAQAEKAIRWKSLAADLKAIEATIWLEDYERIRQNFAPLRDASRAAHENSEKGHKLLEDMYSQSEQYDQEVAATHIKAEQEREKLHSYEETLSEAESRIAVLKTEISHATDNIQRITQEVEQQSKRSGGFASQKEEAQGKIVAFDAELSEIDRQLSELNLEMAALQKRSAEYSAKIENYRELEQEGNLKAQEIRSSISASTAQSDEVRARRQMLVSDDTVRKAAVREAEASLAITTNRHKEATEQADELKNVIQGYELRLDSRKKRALGLRDKLTQLEKEQNNLMTRHHILDTQEKEYQGFSGSVKEVMNEKFPFVHGTLAELINVDNEYTVAVEIALGSALQNIVVGTEDNAKQCIAFLKNKNAGRATFLPISTVNGTVMDMVKGRGFVGVASELVHTDAAYSGIVRSLLGRTAIVQSIDDGIALARANNYRFRIVTLDGQVLNAGGSMTGGSVSKSTGILSRKTEITELEEKLHAVSAELSNVKRDTLTAERELSAVEFDLDTAQSELRSANEQIAVLTSEAMHKQIFLKNAQQHLEHLDAERAALEARLESAADKGAELENALKEAVSELASIAGKLKELNSELEQLVSAQSGLNEQIPSFREKRAAIDALKMAEERNLSEIERLQTELSGDEEQKKTALAGYHIKHTELVEELTALTANVEGLKADSQEQKAVLSTVYARRDELEQQRSALQKAIREQTEKNVELVAEVNRVEGRITTGEADERSIVDKLWEIYELTPTTAAEIRVPVENKQKSVRQIAELKRDIASLGDVNKGAIEAHREMSERLDLLTGQYEDADGAKREIEKIINSITEEMITIFRRQFALINEKFGNTFLEIFGGGLAYLELTDPDDILESSIEIKAQPPGKRLSTLSLLSGGETSLTAIALYFSFFMVRPAPFCLLDEIDHDLDEVNVDRFARYLALLSKHNQFVVITHRRGTMEQANMLYGVTTQEPGVSKVLAMRFEDVAEQGD